MAYKGRVSKWIYTVCSLKSAYMHSNTVVTILHLLHCCLMTFTFYIYYYIALVEYVVMTV